tara:strand:- start:39 stop:332 length:294 start_codon:yes stop_codon:yes gene_type:complete
MRDLAIRSTHPSVVVVNGGIEALDKDGNVVVLDESAITIETDRLQAEYDAQEYARNRAVSFPSWQEQMDMQYHDELNGTTTWKDAVAKVKSDNSKPE